MRIHFLITVVFFFYEINGFGRQGPKNCRFQVNITCDLPANLYLNGVFKGKTEAKKEFILFVKKGNLKLRVVSVENPNNYSERTLKISENAPISKVNISLKESEEEKQIRLKSQQLKLEPAEKEPINAPEIKKPKKK